MGDGDQNQPAPPNARQAADDLIKQDAAGDTGGRPGKSQPAGTKVSLGGAGISKPLLVGGAVAVVALAAIGFAVLHGSSGGSKTATASSAPAKAEQPYNSATFQADTGKLIETGVLWRPTVIVTPQSQIGLDFFTSLDPALAGMPFKDGCIVKLGDQAATTAGTPSSFDAASFMHAEFADDAQASSFFTKFSNDVHNNLLGAGTQFNSQAGGKAFTATVTPPGKPTLLFAGMLDDNHAVFGTANAQSPSTADISEFLNKLSASVAALAEPNTAGTSTPAPSTPSRTVSPSAIGVTTQPVGQNGCDLNEIVHVTISDPQAVGEQAVLRITGPGGGDFPFTVPPGGKYDMPFTQSSGCQPASWNYSIASINGVSVPTAGGPSPN